MSPFPARKESSILWNLGKIESCLWGGATSYFATSLLRVRSLAGRLYEYPYVQGLCCDTMWTSLTAPLQDLQKHKYPVAISSSPSSGWSILQSMEKRRTNDIGFLTECTLEDFLDETNQILILPFFWTILRIFSVELKPLIFSPAVTGKTILLYLLKQQK